MRQVRSLRIVAAADAIVHVGKKALTAELKGIVETAK